METYQREKKCNFLSFLHPFPPMRIYFRKLKRNQPGDLCSRKQSLVKLCLMIIDSLLQLSRCGVFLFCALWLDTFHSHNEQWRFVTAEIPNITWQGHWRMVSCVEWSKENTCKPGCNLRFQTEHDCRLFVSFILTMKCLSKEHLHKDTVETEGADKNILRQICLVFCKCG